METPSSPPPPAVLTYIDIFCSWVERNVGFVMFGQTPANGIQHKYELECFSEYILSIPYMS
jgi:hypothetical protein